jgi:hypothetical protein
MSLANIAEWVNIHGLKQRNLNEMKIRRSIFGHGYHDPTFSLEAYIHRMIERRALLTRIYQLLREKIGKRINVNFTKEDVLFIHISSGDTAYNFTFKNMYDFVVPPIEEYEVLRDRKDYGAYLPIRAAVYETVKQVADEERAAAVSERYEAISKGIGHPQSGDPRHGPVGNIMNFMGVSRHAKRSRKNRKNRSSKARK